MSDCCNGSECSTERYMGCPLCGKTGRSVDKITPEHLLFEKPAAKLQDVIYYFCATPDCKVVYFSPDAGQSFTKKEVKTRVGVKEAVDPIPVCYCFEFTRERIFDEIRQTGGSTAAEYITGKVQSGDCDCEIKNPAGRCCLGEVNRTIKEGMRRFEKPVGVKTN